jgi:hypothetical protein
VTSISGAPAPLATAPPALSLIPDSGTSAAYVAGPRRLPGDHPCECAGSHRSLTDLS